MNNKYIDNVNIEKFKEAEENGFTYGLRRVTATGLIIVSMIPFLAGCGGEKEKVELPDNPRPGYTYFDETERNRIRETSTVYLGEYKTNTAIEELAEFGEYVKEIRLDYCYSIDDLSKIEEYCPNLERINISYCPSISDLTFIYSLPNLKSVHLEESGYVTPELVEYLDRRGIEHNITGQDLADAAELDRIIEEIITDDMTDEEKIQAVTYYVIDNYHYKITKVMESNEKPLSSTLKNKGGVCASYAYLTNILLRKAGVTSYEVTSENKLLGHGWNLIEIDGKYYYLDTTNIKRIPLISKLALKYLNIGFFYMTDPRANSFSVMEDFDHAQKVSIPDEMIEDIERGESEKNIFEKYGNSVPARVIELLLINIALVTGIALTRNGIEAINDSISARQRRKYEEERERREAERKRREAERRRRRY